MKPREYDSQPIQKLINKKELIINELRSKGLRITKQRKLIIDIILMKNVPAVRRSTIRHMAKILLLELQRYTVW